MSKREIAVQLREQLELTEGSIAKLEAEAGAYRAALAALTGRTSNGASRRRIRSGAENRAEALDYLRAHPDVEVSAVTLAADTSIPAGSAKGVLDALVERKLATDAGKTDRGGRLVKHKPRSVKPGEGVR